MSTEEQWWDVDEYFKERIRRICARPDLELPAKEKDAEAEKYFIGTGTPMTLEEKQRLLDKCVKALEDACSQSGKNDFVDWDEVKELHRRVALRAIEIFTSEGPYPSLRETLSDCDGANMAKELRAMADEVELANGAGDLAYCKLKPDEDGLPEELPW